VHPFCAIGRSFGYDGGMDANEKRPWYRLHWGTVLVVFFVGVAWIGEAFPCTIGRFMPSRSWYASQIRLGYVEGWPMACLQAKGSATWINAPALAVDCALALACLVAVAFVTESLERGDLRFRVSTMLTIVAVLAALCAFWRWNSQQTFDYPLPGDSAYNPIDFAIWYTAVPIYFALGCLVYAVIRLTQTAAVRSIAMLIAPFPRRLKRTVARRGDAPSR